MSANIADLRRQRDELDRQITAAEATTAERYTDELFELQEAAERIAAARGLGAEEGKRKNVISVTVDGWLTVEFGWPQDGCTPYLAVQTAGGIRAEFPDQLPPLQAFTGYLTGLIDHDQQEADAQS